MTKDFFVFLFSYALSLRQNYREQRKLRKLKFKNRNFVLRSSKFVKFVFVFVKFVFVVRISKFVFVFVVRSSKFVKIVFVHEVSLETSYDKKFVP